MKLRVAIVIGVLASTSAASAQPAVADQRFQEGLALAQAGKYAEACPKFEESQRAGPALGTQFNLADCYEHTGRPASAWSLFKTVAESARQAGKTEREKVARARAEDLERRLPRLKIIVKNPSGVGIRRDGAEVANQEINEAIPVDPGEHRVEASASNKRPWESKVDVREPGTVDVVVPELEPLTAPAPAPAPPPPSVTAEVAPPSGMTTLQWTGLAIGAVGVVGVGVGSIFGLQASSKNDDSNAAGHCDATGCDAIGKGARNDALDAATISTIAFVAGAALLVGGAVVYFTAPKKSRNLTAISW